MTKFNSKCRDSFSSSSDRKQNGTDDKGKSYHMITLQNNLLLNLINGSWFLLKMAHLSSSFSLSHLKWLKRILVVGLGNCGKWKQKKLRLKQNSLLQVQYKRHGISVPMDTWRSHPGEVCSTCNVRGKDQCWSYRHDTVDGTAIDWHHIQQIYIMIPNLFRLQKLGWIPSMQISWDSQ